MLLLTALLLYLKNGRPLFGCERDVQNATLIGKSHPERIMDFNALHHQNVTLPLNVMCMPTLLDFGTLASLGVRRISMGNFIHAAMQDRLKESLCKIQANQSFSDVFNYENN